jgi:chromosomal replication initiator protein
MYTFARWVSTPENRAALDAVQRVAACVRSRRPRRVVSPLFLHGPPGTGKTHLVSALVEEVTRHSPDLAVTTLSAGDFAIPPNAGQSANPPAGLGRLATCPTGSDSAEETDAVAAARHSDLLVVEDVQHLPATSDDRLVQLFDYLHVRRQQLVFTATVGPRHLAHLSGRLTSRLACGLVVGLEPLAAPSRLAFLQDKAQRRQLPVRHDVLAWLAEHLTGGGRQLEGALARLETLTRLHAHLPDVALVAEHFRAQAAAGRPTVERIAQRVGGYFRVEPRHLQSRQRGRHVLLPRQVGMYLARQLTGLSLEQIGAYFGGRDHSTVLHACRKVEQALVRDAVLSGAVRQLRSDLA